jgi:uncharacterized protein (TIGR03032 family)
MEQVEDCSSDKTSTASAPALALSPSPGFSAWLAGTGGGLAFTTYTAGKLFLLGTRANGALSVFERTIARCMGLGVSTDARSLLLASEYQIYRFDNVVPQGATDPDGHDALFAPHQAWITGDCDIHDIGFGADGMPVFANTLFGCLATVSPGYSFRPVWRPPFITAMAPEDRCHINGMALVEGKPRFVTCVARTDVADGWRAHRDKGGVVIDVSNGEAVVTGLSMPHSPRWHDGRLWLLNSGKGQLGTVDFTTGAVEEVAFLPGFARGLAFTSGHAVIGLSLPRESRTFRGLPLENELARRETEPWCGLAVVDLASGNIAHWLRIEGTAVRELYDVVTLPGVRRPAAIGFQTDEIKHTIAIDAE